MKEDLIPIHLRGSFEVISKSEKRRRIIAGFASVIELDKQDHLITKDALESGVETLLKNSEYANLMLIHRNIQIGKVIDKYNKLTTHVNDEGLFIVAEIRSDLDAANEVWESILSGDYNGFSIAAEVLKSHGECNDDKCWKVIEKMNIFEISVYVPPSQIIQCNPGDKQIKDVKVGDLVFTHNGEYKPILRKFENHYDGDLVVIKPCFTSDKFKLTPNHRILVAKYNKCKQYESWRKSNKVCSPDCGKNCELKPKKLDYEWIPASLLDKNKHLLVYPVDNKILSDEEILSQWNDDWISIRNYRNGGLKKYHLLDKDFWRFVGYWLAEGNTSKYKNHRSTILHPGKHENRNIDDIKNIITNLTNRKCYCRITATNTHDIDFGDKATYHFLQQFKKQPYTFGQKKLPTWVHHLPLELQRELIIGYFRGDSFTSVSKDLLKSIQQILLRFGILISLSKTSNSGTCIIEVRKCKTQDGFSLCVEKSNLRKLLGEDLIHSKKENHLEKWQDNDVLIPISKVSKERYDGVVMNIEVEDANSYSGSLISVHNCNKPVNSKSGFIVISKGEKLPDNVIENVYKHVGNNMTKKKTSPSEIEKEEVPKEEIQKEEIIKDEPEAPKQEETTEKSEFNIEAAIEEIKRQVAALTGTIAEMNKAEEEDEDMEDDEDKEEEKETKKSDDDCKDCDPEIKSDDELSEKIDDLVSLSDYNSFLMSYFENEKDGSIESAMEVWNKRDEKTSDEILEDIKKSVESVISRLDKEDKIIELNSAIKIRDDKISELETKLNVIEKADDEAELPKVEQKEEKTKEEPIEKAEKEEPKTLVNEESKEILFDSPIIIKNGTVSANK